MSSVKQRYDQAREQYAQWGIDTEEALKRLSEISLSMHCWQGDDFMGFENSGGLTGGIQVTGNHPGKARSPEELRADIDKAFSLIPGRKRLSLHAIYGEGRRGAERTSLEPAHFTAWVQWAKEQKTALDFNPTFFSHRLSADGYTLASRDDAIRRYWVEHGIASRKVGEYLGRELADRCVTNIWVPDGEKEWPVDSYSPRKRLMESLDEILAADVDRRYNLDAVESKLFGIGSESYVAGSHEFYMGYAITRKVALTLDAGHFHPTESIAGKFSALLLYVPEILLHVSRSVRWDSDHVVILDDDLTAIAREAVLSQQLERIHFALDYFDGSINRVVAWVSGMRATQKALLKALLYPFASLAELEEKGDNSGRMALSEEYKLMPLGAIWDWYCESKGVPSGISWLDEVRAYEQDVMAERN